MAELLLGCMHTVVMLQEHHISATLLADAQARGVWPDAKEPGNAGGTQSGLAILARPTAMMTRAQFMTAGSLADGRALPAQVHWGVPGGLMLITMYSYVNEGWSDNNIYVMQEVSSYAERLNYAGYDWIVVGDFN
eukprot:6343000-Pyramimonas_sp.AAC.1